MKPTAYITYKGHLLHADDPKVLEHSNPEPLYSSEQIADTKRLEWLAKAQRVLIKDFDGLVFPYWHTSGRRGEAKPTFREAIDSAMSGAKEVK